MALRVAFFGTPEFAVPTLDALVGSVHRVVLVVTQPDRPRGRGQHIEPTPVKTHALHHGIDVLQPDKIRDEAFLAAVDAARIDLGVVAAYGKILPQRLLDLPRLGMINVHASLLPRWRGAAPIHRAVLAGDRETGITIMRVVRELDAGPMISAERLLIDGEETSTELERRLSVVGGRLLVETVDLLARGPVTEVEQNAAEATYAARLERRESRVDWTQPAQVIHNQIRGLQPWPMAVVVWRSKRLRLRRSRVVPGGPNTGMPGTITEVHRDALVIATGSGSIALTDVQVEGKAAGAMSEFLNGYQLRAGERLDPLPVG